MERLKERYEILNNALKSFNESIVYFKELDANNKYYKSLRNSVIKSFEYSYDTFWKFLKEYLEKMQGLMPQANPRTVFKTCFDNKLITQEELNQCLKLLEDRNLTSHTYNESLAQQVSQEIEQYFIVIKTITDRISSKIK